MNQATTYKKSVYDYDESIPYTEVPTPVWKRYYGKGTETCRRTGQRDSKAMYLGFADGSRLRVYRGGEVTVL